MKRLTRHAFTALLLLCLAAAVNSCTRAQSNASGESPAPTTQPRTEGAGEAEALVAAIRNDQLIWEIESPTPDTYKDLKVGPHWSPRGRPGSPVAILMPWEPRYVAQFYPPPPPYPVERLAQPLLTALADPDRWVAAHVVLTHLVIRADGTKEARKRLWKSLQWPKEYRLKEYATWSDEDFVSGNAGNFVYTVAGLRSELMPYGESRIFDYGGSYGGKYEVRAASARIDEAQRPALLAWWNDHLSAMQVVGP